MNRIFEIAAIALGGVSLFTVCFLGFAAMAGVPLNEVAVLGKIFPEAPDPGEPKPVSSQDQGEGIEFDSPDEVYAHTQGVLSAFRLDPPFTGSELKSLGDELKLKNIQLEQRLREVSGREEALDQREEALADQFEALDEMRAKLEAFEQELSLRAEEIGRDEAAAEEAAQQRWTALAAVFAEQRAEDAVTRLKAYSPEDATKILLNLDKSQAIEILDEFKGEDFKRYSEAFAQGEADLRSRP